MSDELLLYLTAPGWGLPSLDPSCIQAYAYLHLAGVPLSVQECSLSRSAPTGEFAGSWFLLSWHAAARPRRSMLRRAFGRAAAIVDAATPSNGKPAWCKVHAVW
jgi:hypothetical protein